MPPLDQARVSASCMRKMLGLAVLLTAGALLTLLGFKGLLPDRHFVRELVVHLDDYSGQKHDGFKKKDLGDPAAYPEIVIDFRFRAGHVEANENVFQTAPGNRGIRMELNPLDERTYVAGLVVGTDPAGHARGFSLPGRFDYGTIYHSTIAYRNGVVSAATNGSEVLRERVGDPHPQISEIRSGAGFDDLRKFSGEVDDFKLSLGLRATNAPNTFKLVRDAMFGLALLGVLLMGAFFRVLKQEQREEVDVPSKRLPAAERGWVRRDDLLLVLRGFACLVVLLTHVFGTVGQPETWSRLLMIGDYNATWLFHSVAWIGMWIFFTLSGYLMGKAFFSRRYSVTYRGILSFYHNRALRIIPLYLFALFIVVFFAKVELVRWEFLDVLIRHLTFTYDGRQSANPIGALWSISTEMHYYLVVPFLALMFVEKHVSNRSWFFVHVAAIIVLGFAARTAFAALTQHDHLHWLYYVYTPFVSNSDLFLTGFFLSAALSGGFGTRLKLFTVVYRHVPTFLALCLVGLYLLGTRMMYLGLLAGQPSALRFVDEVLPTITLVTTTIMIIVIEARKHFERANGTLKRRKSVHNLVLGMLEHFGVITYGIYVWHSPIMEQLMRVIPLSDAWSTYLWRLGATLVISIGLSQFTYVFLERPMEKKKAFA